MVKTGKLKNAARMLHSCEDDIDGSADGSTVALHAFSSDRHRAAYAVDKSGEIRAKAQTYCITWHVYGFTALFGSDEQILYSRCDPI